MCGNVAEWISETVKTKGGSWNLPPYNARIDLKGYYDGDSSANPEIGFRYVVEIISVKADTEYVTMNPKYFKKTFRYIPRDSSDKNYQYAGECEVTNAEFNTFLKTTSDTQFRLHSENWNIYFPYKYYEM